MSEPVLGWRALNRAVLARQQLLTRAELPMAEVLRRMGGLQAQYAPAMYIGLWSRMVDFRRSALTAALHDRSLVQATLMRSTIHLVARADYWPLELAIRAERQAWYLRAARPAVTVEQVADAAATVREAIAGKAAGPRFCRRSTGPGCSTSAIRTRSTPSWSTGRWPGPGGMPRGGLRSRSSGHCRVRNVGRCPKRPTG
jgi:hypothetical protein